MEELFDPGEMLDNPLVLLLALVGGGGGLVAFMMIGSYFTTGDTSDRIRGIVLLMFQG